MLAWVTWEPSSHSGLTASAALEYIAITGAGSVPLVLPVPNDRLCRCRGRTCERGATAAAPPRGCSPLRTPRMTPHTPTIQLQSQLPTSELALHVGQVLGSSDWRVIEQADANAFGAATHDQQWIHTDPHACGDGPFGRTIAHGYLTLSLATSPGRRGLRRSRTRVMVVNYGVDRVRSRRPAGRARRSAPRSACRACATSRRGPGDPHLEYEVAGQDKPCCVADVLLRYYTDAECETMTTGARRRPVAHRRSAGADARSRIPTPPGSARRWPGRWRSAAPSRVEPARPPWRFAGSLAEAGAGRWSRLLGGRQARRPPFRPPTGASPTPPGSENPAFFALRGGLPRRVHVWVRTCSPPGRGSVGDAKAQLA